MDIQLQYKDTNHFAFVYPTTKLARGASRGKFVFEVKFVRYIVPPSGGDGYNKPAGTKRMTLDQFALWFKNSPDWRIVG